MITANQIATKIESILNQVSFENAYGFVFKAKTYAEFLDDRAIIVDNEKKNFIPVFIDNPSGSYQPIGNAIISNYQYSVKLYFPMEDKDDIFSLLQDISEYLVGEIWNIDGYTMLVNMGVPQFAQITTANLTEFQEWVGYLYQEKIRKSSYFVEVNIPLLLAYGITKSGFNNLALGNEFVYELSIYDDNIDNYIVKNYKIIRNEASSNMANTLQTEQLESVYLAQNVVSSSNYIETFNMFIDSTIITPSILKTILNGEINDERYDIYLKIYQSSVETNNVIIDSMSMAIQKATLVAKPGQLAFIQLALVKRKS